MKAAVKYNRRVVRPFFLSFFIARKFRVFGIPRGSFLLDIIPRSANKNKACTKGREKNEKTSFRSQQQRVESMHGINTLQIIITGIYIYKSIRMFRVNDWTRITEYYLIIFFSFFYYRLCKHGKLSRKRKGRRKLFLMYIQ